MRLWLVTLAVFVVVTPIAMMAVYLLAVTIAPPVTPEGYGLMPIGQVMLGIALGPLVGGAAAWFARHRLSRPASAR